MKTIKLEIEDGKLDILLNIIMNLKEDIVKKYEVVNSDQKRQNFIEISQEPLKKIWDNEEDDVYDKFLEI
jgi:hypothetical protein